MNGKLSLLAYSGCPVGKLNRLAAIDPTSLDLLGSGEYHTETNDTVIFAISRNAQTFVFGDIAHLRAYVRRVLLLLASPSTLYH